MRGGMGATEPLSRLINNLAMSLEREEVIIPRHVPMEDLLWKFNDSNDPVAIPNCDKEQLFAVVKGLMRKVIDLEDEILREKSAKEAALALL